MDTVTHASSKEDLLEILSQQKKIVEVHISDFPEKHYRDGNRRLLVNYARETVKEGLDEWADTDQHEIDVYYHDEDAAANVIEIFASILEETGYNTVRFHKLPRDGGIGDEKAIEIAESENPVFVVCRGEDEIDRAVEKLINYVNDSSPPIFAVTPYSKRLEEAYKLDRRVIAGLSISNTFVSSLFAYCMKNHGYDDPILPFLTSFTILAFLPPIYYIGSDILVKWNMGNKYYLVRRVDGN